MSDRTYWHVPGARSWHADSGCNGADGKHWSEWRCAACGRLSHLLVRYLDTADRVPPNAHLCGSCSRVIAARTDIEAA